MENMEILMSGQIVSKYFHMVLRSILKLHSLFFVNPEPIPEDSTDPRWGKFKGCLGALDGMYIDVLVPTVDKGRYRNCKGHVSVNVLGVCDINMRFLYILTGWEGSAADSRVLRDAIHRPNSLRVPRGNIDIYITMSFLHVRQWLSELFLTPYKGVRYHLNEWSNRRPQTSREYFNMKHTRCQNVIKRIQFLKDALENFTEPVLVLIMDVGGMENEKVKGSRGRRSWTRAEEESLIQ
ncbi:hypothetical protein ACS0TY_011961 [Phlomoides rotata]